MTTIPVLGAVRLACAAAILASTLPACAAHRRPAEAAAPASDGVTAVLLAVLQSEARLGGGGTAPFCLALRGPDARVGELGADPPAAVTAAVARVYPGAVAVSACRRRQAAPDSTPLRVVWAPPALPGPGVAFTAGVVVVRNLGPFSWSGTDYECRRGAAGAPECRPSAVWNSYPRRHR